MLGMCFAAYLRVTNKSMFETIFCHHNKEVSNMQFHIISSLGVCLSEKGFSLGGPPDYLQSVFPI